MIESAQIAKDNGLEDEFFDILSLTEGDDFKEKSLSRINNTLSNSKRKSEELEEIIDYFKEEAESDSLADAMAALGNDYDEMEIRLVRIKFLCEIAS